MTSSQTRLIITGGTLDKTYNDNTGSLEFSDSIISLLLERARCSAEIEVEHLMQVDSLEMTHEQRDLIIQVVRKAKEERIIITHGTDTLVSTARLLENIKLNKTIVLVGAMVPWRFANSDADFNIGYALGACQSLGRGVWVTMNGKIFPALRVCKNRELGRFEDL